MTVDEICLRASNELHMPYDYVRRIYRTYWRAIHDYLSRYDMMEIDPEDRDTFEAYHPVAKVLGLGYFYCTYNRFRYMRTKENKRKYLKQVGEYVKDKEHTSDIQQDIDDDGDIRE